MNGIDGLLYLLNQAGVALSVAEQQVQALQAQNAALQAQLASIQPSDEPAP